MGQTLFAALGAAALLFFAFGSWAVLKALRRLRFVEPVVEPIDAAALPAPVRALLAPSAARLVELGFVEAAAMRTAAQVVDGQAQALHSLVFTHPAVAAVAYLSQQIGAQRDRDDTVQFASRLHDGTGLVTRNRMAISGPLPLAHLVTLDCWLPSWAALWQAHRQRMQQMQPDAAQWRRLSGADAVATSADSEAQAFRTRVARGDYVATDGGAWRIGTRFAALTLARAWRWLLPSMQRMPVDAAPGAPTGADATQAWVEAYERDLREQRTSRWSGGAKWLLFAATGALALASFGLAMDGGTLLALMLVLLFHEMGHFVAMRWAGYADLKVFFLPFLGAAVSGRHERPTLRQELIVLYAGPLPGLVLGVAVLFVIGPETPLAPWWRELATLAIVLNALNLLPIHPLDGGKVFELLLLGRWPALAFAARLAGMAALALLATSMDGPGRIALLALALLMSLGIGHLWREARVARALQKSGQWGGLDRRAALAALFERIAALGYGALPQASRHLMVGALLPGLMRPPLRRAARLGGTLLYGALLAGALLAVVVQVFIGVNSATQMASAAASRAAPHDAVEMAQRWADERNAEIESLRRRAAAEADPQRRWALIEPELQEIAQQVASSEAGRLSAGAALLQEARELAPKLADAPAAVAAAELALSDAAVDEAARLRHIDAALATYDAAGAQRADAAPLLRATAGWLHANSSADAGQRLARVERSLAVAGERGESSVRQTLRAAQADLLLAGGQREHAFALMQQALQQADETIGATLAARTLIDATWADQGAAAALQRLDQTLPRLAAAASGGERFAVDELVRHGMWLAEDAGRSDWQRAHVDALAAAQAKAAELPLWLRALLWWQGAPNMSGSTLRDLEHAHWRGDGESARRIAAELRQRLPGFALPLHLHHGSQHFIGPRIGERMAALRRRFAERYGLPVREPAGPDAALPR